MGSWDLHNINLEVTKKARVVFEGVRGESPSKGGFSLDDINLSSTKCPQHIWHIRNITHLLATTPVGQKVYSPRFLSPAGYSFQVFKDFILSMLNTHLLWSSLTHSAITRCTVLLRFAVICRSVCT